MHHTTSINHAYNKKTGWPYQRTIEPAGRRFAGFLKKKTGEFHEIEEEKEEDKKEEGDDAAFTAKMANKHKTWSKEKAEDYYELLGLGDLRWRSSADEIKASCMFASFSFVIVPLFLLNS